MAGHAALLQGQAQALRQKGLDGIAPGHKLGGVGVQEHKIVHIAQVVARPELVLDELVQLVQVHIGKKLAGQVANGQATPRLLRCQALVRWHGGKARGRAFAAHALGGRCLQQGAAQGLQRARLVGCQALAAHRAHQAVLKQPKQRGPVDAVEEVGNVQLQGIPLAALALPCRARAHALLQPVHRCQRALAFAVGIAVVDENGLVQACQALGQQVVHHAVGKRGGMDFTPLGLVHHKTQVRGGAPACAGQGVARLHQAVEQTGLVLLGVAGVALALAAGPVGPPQGVQAKGRRVAGALWRVGSHGFTLRYAQAEHGWCWSCCWRWCCHC